MTGWPAEALVLFTIAASFGVGAVLIGLFSLLPSFRSRIAELWVLYRSEVLIIGAILIPAALGGWSFAALLIAFVWRGQLEVFGVFDLPIWGPAQFAAAITTATLVIAATLLNFSLLDFALGPGIAVVALVGLATSENRRVQSAIIGASTLVYPGLLAALIAALRAGTDGFGWLFLVYATVEIADSFALLFGKLFGRTRILPQLSPKKTAEGMIAGFCFGGTAGVLLAHYLTFLSWTASFRTAAAIVLFGLAGDLATSALKRWRKKKDFARLLTLHGGALDIYDSFLLAAPAVFLLRGFLAG